MTAWPGQAHDLGNPPAALKAPTLEPQPPAARLADRPEVDETILKHS
jgi:hypothetical protein